MRQSHLHKEGHFVSRIGWIRAAVLGANDGIVSTASLIVGVAASGATKGNIIVAGVAGLVGGAMSMAAGEYVSVSSQSDAEHADLAREKDELATDPRFELQELTNIYVARGLDPALAGQVAKQLMAKDALAAHARDELGISETTTARPIQAAMASASSFAVGAILPMVTVALTPVGAVIPVMFVSSLFFLAALGAVGARTGGAQILKPVIRVVFWGAVALAVTAGIGALFGIVA
jgi:VIT1/CCC1 family predicted Fe2+/Mn2+ transporter